jgi:fumarylacetoacetase
MTTEGPASGSVGFCKCLGKLRALPFGAEEYRTHSLNKMMKYGKKACSALRMRLADLLNANQDAVVKDELRSCLIKMSEVQMHLPIEIGDYTDFYSSMDHARNVGTMFRDPAKALLPNWKHLPVGYHGRASSIVVDGTAVTRPCGQVNASDETLPTYGPTKQLDFELEMAFITFDGKPMGERISTQEADDYIFGLMLFNDWSARDIQRWEYVPLGPFLAKNFASTVSPFFSTSAALAFSASCFLANNGLAASNNFGIASWIALASSPFTASSNAVLAVVYVVLSSSVN